MRTLLSLPLVLAAPAAAQTIPTAPSPAYNRAIAAGYKAAMYCSGIFVAGRTPAQIDRDELAGIYPEYDRIVPTLKAEVINNTAIAVTVAFDPALPPRLAVWRPWHGGCVLRPIGTPVRLVPLWHVPRPSIRPADPDRWPIGDAGIAPQPPALVTAAVTRAFDARSYGTKSKTTGVVIVRDGEVVAERYADGWGPFVANRTWSVAKSIAGTLAGRLTQQGLIDVTNPANVPEWQTRGDPRAAITLDQLLRMSSGLHSDTSGNRTDAIYFGGKAVTEETVNWPLQTTPGTRFRYANNDTLLAVRAMRATVTPSRAATLPNSVLSALRMSHTIAETDWQGNYILSSQVWSTARDLGRLGQFWLQDGVWQGKRLLPEGWMRYMTTPSGPQPADGPGYGATLWLFGPKQGLPDGSYAAQGNRGQYVMVIPSKRLVIVRRGEDPGTARFDIARFSADIAEALP